MRHKLSKPAAQTLRNLLKRLEAEDISVHMLKLESTNHSSGLSLSDDDDDEFVWTEGRLEIRWEERKDS